MAALSCLARWDEAADPAADDASDSIAKRVLAAQYVIRRHVEPWLTIALLYLIAAVYRLPPRIRAAAVRHRAADLALVVLERLEPAADLAIRVGTRWGRCVRRPRHQQPGEADPEAGVPDCVHQKDQPRSAVGLQYRGCPKPGQRDSAKGRPKPRVARRCPR